MTEKPSDNFPRTEDYRDTYADLPVGCYLIGETIRTVLTRFRSIHPRAKPSDATRDAAIAETLIMPIEGVRELVKALNSQLALYDQLKKQASAPN